MKQNECIIFLWCRDEHGDLLQLWSQLFSMSWSIFLFMYTHNTAMFQQLHICNLLININLIYLLLTIANPWAWTHNDSLPASNFQIMAMDDLCSFIHNNRRCWMRRPDAQFIPMVFRWVVVRARSCSSTPTLANYVFMDLSMCTDTMGNVMENVCLLNYFQLNECDSWINAAC